MLPGQLDMLQWLEAKQRRDVGMAQAAAAQGEQWGDIAYRAIERVAQRQVHVHIDDILAEAVPAPDHPNAWGTVWLRAIRAGIIQRSNQVSPCKTDPQKHGHNYPVYFSRIMRRAI